MIKLAILLLFKKYFKRFMCDCNKFTGTYELTHHFPFWQIANINNQVKERKKKITLDIP